MIRVGCLNRHPVEFVTTASFGLRISGNGAYNAVPWCNACDRWASEAIPLYQLRALGIEQSALPVIADYRGAIGRCARKGCELDAVEYHHFAPYALFGAEADEWPTALLCREHHSEWHQRTRTA